MMKTQIHWWSKPLSVTEITREIFFFFFFFKKKKKKKKKKKMFCMFWTANVKPSYSTSKYSLRIAAKVSFKWTKHRTAFSKQKCLWLLASNWLLRQKAITTPLRKSLDKQFRDTSICQWKLHSYLYLSIKMYIGNFVCLSNNINR